MQGCALKATLFTVALLSTMFSCSLVFAAKIEAAGCMGCHQIETTMPEERRDTTHSKHNNAKQKRQLMSEQKREKQSY